MTVNCKGNLIDLTTPKVMGILNVTPDSFYDGGKFSSDVVVLKQVEKMLMDGANFIDVGGQTTKPTADMITAEEELKRVIPVVDSILKNFPDALLSIDTFYAKVAEETILNGAALINDVSAGNLDGDMLPMVAKLQVPYIMMHMRGTPQTMQKLTQYDDLVKEVLFYFSEKITQARSLGIYDIIVDPGFGFAKTLDQNYELLSRLDLFQMLELPVLVGVSRKSMIYKVLETASEHALNGTTVLNTLALTKGANILRVHDVKEAVECVRLISQLG
ncbi:dihydropteroate synthase [Flavobacterium amniphilum]|uniref:dihydropteroate synthase n=1 Tax=Flavobacterium amniphilum TaxID=1834035 RepID=UPI002029F4B0|nr:dihydropteroate synthase [Flavobacterium amniphilum]MCL9805723.1 dihydropteroate synthase [Flavobacterium amniphilum]MCL9806310.1 dihydropteroate synthase [Flavobacterium amniphilum]